MTITQVAQKVLADKGAVQVRFRAGGKGEVKEYDCKPLFCGKRRGWVIVDLTTANAIETVHKGLREDLRPSMDRIPLGRLIDFCWSAVSR